MDHSNMQHTVLQAYIRAAQDSNSAADLTLPKDRYLRGDKEYLDVHIRAGGSHSH